MGALDRPPPCSLALLGLGGWLSSGLATPGRMVVMPRAIWSGSVSFGLVNVPVKLVTATSSKDVRFHQLHDTDGGRIKQKRVCSLDGEEVDYSEIVKGYELSGGQYVIVEPEELEALSPEASRSIDIEEFVDLAEIDPLYFEHSYYLVPDERGGHGLTPCWSRPWPGPGRSASAVSCCAPSSTWPRCRPRDGALVLVDHAVRRRGGRHRRPRRQDDRARPSRPSARAEHGPPARRVAVGGMGTRESTRTTTGKKSWRLIEAKAEGNEFAMPGGARAPAPVVDLMAALEASLARAKEADARTGARRRGCQAPPEAR